MANHSEKEEIRTDTEGKVKSESGKNKTAVGVLTRIGLLGALATVLSVFPKIPVPFAPVFYKIDFSEIPVLLGSFSMGPMAGVTLELIKTLLNLVIDSTNTMGIGEAANFIMGCAFCVPAAVIYKRKKTKARAIAGCAAGVSLMVVVGCLLNAYVLLPVYAKAFHMSIDGIVGMGTKLNGHIKGLGTFVMLAVAPFNLLKGILNALVVILIYKKLSRFLKVR